MKNVISKISHLQQFLTAICAAFVTASLLTACSHTSKQEGDNGSIGAGNIKEETKTDHATGFVASPKIHFEFNSSKLADQDKAELLAFATEIKSRATLKQIVIEGHADAAGPDSYNYLLSEKRAQTVAEFLIANGVDKNLIRTTGYGSSRQLPNSAASLQRRIEFSILE